MGWVMEDLNIILDLNVPREASRSHPKTEVWKGVITHRWLSQKPVFSTFLLLLCEESPSVESDSPSEMPPVSVGLDWETSVT